MKLGPVGRELDAWGPIVERMAAVEAAHAFGNGELITEREYVELRALFAWVFLNTGAA